MSSRSYASSENELVLVDRPLNLKVKIVKPRTIASVADADTEGPTIYLKPRVQQWSRDAAKKAKVKRIGFPLVPEFGGTVHAYCGTTLSAAQSDLLEWHRKPSVDDMQKAYINESRVSSLDQLLIVQQYSPDLFRQGELPGPRILMEVLRGNISTAEAREEWKHVERQQAKAKKSDEWPQSMLLACSSCTLKNSGKEVLKRLRTFTAGTKLTDYWDAISRGQDLECIRCMQARLRKIESGIIYCETCEAYCPDTAFSSQAKHILVNGLAGVVQCESCEHGRTGMTQAETIFERCVVCRRDWPESGFQRDALQAWRDKKQQHLITCAGCVLIAMRQYRDEERECTRCNQKLPLLRTRTNSSIGRPALEAAQNTAVDLVSQHGDGPLLRTRTNSSIGRPALEAAQNTAVDLVSQHGDELPVWSPVTLRIFLDRGENSVQWLCYNCLHPACSVSSCRERPRFPARRLPDTTEPYLCNVCLWPLCSGGCGAERPRGTQWRVTNMTHWYLQPLQAREQTALSGLPGGESLQRVHSPYRQELPRPMPDMRGDLAM